MASRSFGPLGPGVPGVRSVVGTAARPDRSTGLRQRVDLVTPSAARAVRYAGGWLFDHVMAGWDVAVHVAEPTDTRALQILGARVVDLDQTLAGYGPLPDTLAVDADLYRTDHRVRDLVDAVAAGESRTDIRLWGECCPDGRGGSFSHRLSVAARAFKAQALAAAASPADAIDEAELFLAELTTLQLAR